MKRLIFISLLIYVFNISYSQESNNHAKHLVVIFDKSGSMQNKIKSQKIIIQKQLFNLIDTTLTEGDYISILKHGIEKNAKNLDNIFRVEEPYKYFPYSNDKKNQLQNDLISIVDEPYYGNWNLSYSVPFLGMNYLHQNDKTIDHYYVLYITDEQGVLGDLTHEIKQIKYARGGLLDVKEAIQQILEINKYYYREVEHVFEEGRIKMFLMEIRPLYSFIDLIYGFPTHPVTFNKTTKGYKYLLDLDVFNKDKKYLIEKVDIEVTKNDGSQVFFKEYNNLTDNLDLEIVLNDINFEDSYKLNMQTFIKYDAAGFKNFMFGCNKDIPNICNTIDKTCDIKFEKYEDVLWFKMNDGLFNTFAKDGENQSDAIHRLKMWFWISFIILIPIIILILIIIRNSIRNKKTKIEIGDDNNNKNKNLVKKDIDKNTKNTNTEKNKTKFENNINNNKQNKLQNNDSKNAKIVSNNQSNTTHNNKQEKIENNKKTNNNSKIKTEKNKINKKKGSKEKKSFFAKLFGGKDKKQKENKKQNINKNTNSTKEITKKDKQKSKNNSNNKKTGFDNNSQNVNKTNLNNKNNKKTISFENNNTKQNKNKNKISFDD